MHIPRLFLTADDLSKPASPGWRAKPAGTLDLQPGTTVEIASEAIRNQLINVLRLTPGNKVILLNGCGLAFESVLDAASRHAVQCTVLARTALQDSRPNVSVALAIIKRDRFDWALQKLTELGATEVVPLFTDRTVVKIDMRDAKGVETKRSRWHSILREAAEQSERATIPHLVNPRSFESWVSEITAGGTSDTAFICAERIPCTHLRDILLPAMSQKENFSGTTGKTIHLIVGPEGGFTSDEIEYARARGVKPVSLGHRVLRSETAAIYALAQVMWCLEI